MNRYKNQTHLKNNTKGKKFQNNHKVSTTMKLIKGILLHKSTFVTISLIMSNILWSPTITRFSFLSLKNVFAQTQPNRDTPEKNLERLTFVQFFQQYWYWFVLTFAFLIIVVETIIISQQKQTERALRKSAEKQNEIIEEQKRIETELKKTNEERKQQAQILEEGIYELLNDLEGALDGDLTVRANLNSMEMSTVADLFNAIIDNLNDIAVQVKKSTTQVGSSLENDQKSIQLLAQQALQERQQTQKTLESVEKMSNSIQDVMKNANFASNLANDAFNVTQDGASAMTETEHSIFSLRTTVGETAKKIKRLGESCQKISQVVSIINQIALKTNLLAINASVEASRAGEQGAGFTLVAEQVGALAEQSSAATKEIEEIVRTIQLETQEVTEAMELGTSQVVKTTQLVESTKERLGKILERSKNINEIMQLISQSTISQTKTSGLVMNLMKKIAQNSDQRLNFSRDVSESIYSTAEVAKELESAVAQFKIKETN